ASATKRRWALKARSIRSSMALKVIARRASSSPLSLTSSRVESDSWASPWRAIASAVEVILLTGDSARPASSQPPHVASSTPPAPAVRRSWLNSLSTSSCRRSDSPTTFMPTTRLPATVAVYLGNSTGWISTRTRSPSTLTVRYPQLPSWMAPGPIASTSPLGTSPLLLCSLRSWLVTRKNSPLLTWASISSSDGYTTSSVHPSFGVGTSWPFHSLYSGVPTWALPLERRLSTSFSRARARKVESSTPSREMMRTRTRGHDAEGRNRSERRQLLDGRRRPRLVAAWPSGSPVRVTARGSIVASGRSQRRAGSG